MSDRIRYRLDHEGKRHRVIVLRGWEGFVVRWSQHCSGCTETGEYEMPDERGVGCDECGYTGRTRRAEWVPFDAAEYLAWDEKRWQRRQRLLQYFAARRAA